MHTTSKKQILQFVRYALVGVLNTLLTLVMIFLCKSVIGINEYIANALGYVVGLINSFIWNRQWVFHSNGKMTRQAVHFLIAFGICYCLQFAVVWGLTQSTFGTTVYTLPAGMAISGYGIATLIGNVVYTLANFTYNRRFTFK